MEWFFLISILIFSGFIRFIPHLIAPHGVGVDHWYWKSYIEEYRKNRRFPPVLPQFLLELHQWYPPLFPLIMAKLPKSIFDRNSHILSIGIDLKVSCKFKEFLKVIIPLAEKNEFKVLNF